MSSAYGGPPCTPGDGSDTCIFPADDAAPEDASGDAADGGISTPSDAAEAGPTEGGSDAAVTGQP
jgi:hypothetical protein